MVLLPMSIQKPKIPFQISSDEKTLFFGAKGSGQSFGLFPPPPPYPVMLLNDLHFLLRPPGYGVQVVWSAF